jgi:putative transposase
VPSKSAPQKNPCLRDLRQGITHAPMSSVVFHPYNSHLPTAVYRRDLPHWRQEGCTYFVTFRLADSIPRSIALAWAQERRDWLEAHGIRGGLNPAENERLYRAIPERERKAFEKWFAHRLHVEVDRGHGGCVLARPEMRNVVKSALNHFAGVRYGCGDWAIMPNHVHWLVAPMGGCTLEAILKTIKGFVSVQASAMGLKSGRLWQPESYDRIVRNNQELRAFRNYIAQNALKANVAEGRHERFEAEWLEA